MAIRISPDVLDKITKRNIRVIEIEQCFLNRVVVYVTTRALTTSPIR